MRRSYPPKSLWAQSYGVFVWSQSCNLSGPGPQFSWTKWTAKRRQVAGETNWEDPSFVCFSVIHRLESLGLGWRPELSVEDWRVWRPPKCVGISWQHPLCPADDHSWNKAWNRKVQKFGARNSTKPSYQLGQAICQTCSDRSITAMCQNKNSWIIASAQLASTVFKACFARTKAKNSATTTSLKIAQTGLCVFQLNIWRPKLGARHLVLDCSAVGILFILIDTLFTILWFVWD